MAEFKIVLNHNINFAQMFRLMAMLSDAKIPFDVITLADGLQKENFIRICQNLL